MFNLNVQKVDLGKLLEFTGESEEEANFFEALKNVFEEKQYPKDRIKILESPCYYDVEQEQFQSL